MCWYATTGLSKNMVLLIILFYWFTTITTTEGRIINEKNHQLYKIAKQRMILQMSNCLCEDHKKLIDNLLMDIQNITYRIEIESVGLESLHRDLRIIINMNFCKSFESMVKFIVRKIRSMTIVNNIAGTKTIDPITREDLNNLVIVEKMISQRHILSECEYINIKNKDFIDKNFGSKLSDGVDCMSHYYKEALKTSLNKI